MRIWALSDLHTEFRPFRLPDVLPRADVCVVAGDVCTKGPARSIEFLRPLAEVMPVVFVAGNHEFYGSSIVEGLNEARLAATGTGVHFLENDTVEIDGVTFIGATLWTDLGLLGHQSISTYEVGRSMTDYRKIKLSKRPFRRMTTYATVHMHLESRAFIRRNLVSGVAGRSVVVTHHAPSAMSLPREFAADDAAPAYASALDELILECRPTLWVHGHVHSVADYRIGDTRVLSNPRGYPGERTDFRADRVVEI